MVIQFLLMLHVIAKNVILGDEILNSVGGVSPPDGESFK